MISLSWRAQSTAVLQPPPNSFYYLNCNCLQGMAPALHVCLNQMPALKPRHQRAEEVSSTEMSQPPSRSWSLDFPIGRTMLYRCASTVGQKTYCVFAETVSRCFRLPSGLEWMKFIERKWSRLLREVRRYLDRATSVVKKTLEQQKKEKQSTSCPSSPFRLWLPHSWHFLSLFLSLSSPSLVFSVVPIVYSSNLFCVPPSLPSY